MKSPLPLLLALPGLLTLAGLLALAGCAAVNPTVAGLERAKALAAEGRHAEVARLDVACAPAAPGCSQLRLVKADSCRRLAEAGEAAARRRSLDCAAEHYAKALLAARAAPDPMAPAARLAPALLESLQARRDLAPDRADALDVNARLGEAARGALAEARPAALVFGADAELAGVLLGAPAGGCDAIARAGALLAEARPAGTEVAARADQLGRAVTNARRARGCVA